MKQKNDMLKAFEKEKSRNNDFKAMNVSKIHGSITLSDISSNLEKKFQVPFSESESMETLKKYRLCTKNYANMFQTKGKVLVDILTDLLTKYQFQATEISDFFKKKRKEIKTKLQGQILTEVDLQHMNHLKSFGSDLDLEVRARKEELKEMIEIIGESDEKSIKPGYLNTIRNTIQSYVNSISLLIHKIEKDKTPHAQLSTFFSYPETNPNLLEFLMKINFECLRRFCLEVVVPKIFDIHKRFQDKITQGAELLHHFHKSHPLVLNHLDSSHLRFKLSSLLDPPLRQYIKTKICLEQRIILKDNDLHDFFVEKFEFKYPEINPFWVSYLNVLLENPKTKETTAFYLTLDVAPL